MDAVPVKFYQDIVGFLSVQSVSELCKVTEYYGTWIKEHLFKLEVDVRANDEDIVSKRNLFTGRPVQAPPKYCKGIQMDFWTDELARATMKQILQAQPYCQKFSLNIARIAVNQELAESLLKFNVTDLLIDDISSDGKEFLLKELVSKGTLVDISTDSRFGEVRSQDARTRNLSALLPVLLQPQFRRICIDATPEDIREIERTVAAFLRKNTCRKICFSRETYWGDPYLAVTSQ